MTARQLYYTSSDAGRDGRSGFQINAATPGIRQGAEDFAIRASTYDPPSALLASDPGDLPVTLGFTRRRGITVIYRSVYAGADFAGRLGNYFAHALVVDDLAEDLGGLLPIDLWAAPHWSTTTSDSVELPALGVLSAGSGADQDATADFLTRPDRRAVLAAVLAAVLEARSRGERVVLVCAAPGEAPLWVSAVTRSLPHDIALEITFSTWSGRPEEADALLIATTPDVRVRPEPGLVVLNLALADDAPIPSGGSPFATTLAEAWGGGPDAVLEVLRLLDGTPADALDDVAPLAGWTVGRGGALDAAGIGALELVLTRPAPGPPPWPWPQLWSGLERAVSGSAATDLLPTVARALAAATERVVPPPPASLHRALAQRVLAALHDPASAALAASVTWLPELDRQAWSHLFPDDAEVLRPPATATLPLLCGTAPPGLVARLAELADLSDLTDAELADLDPGMADLLAPGGAPGGRAERLVELVRARHEPALRVATWGRLAEPGENADRLIDVLWPEGLPPGDALRLLDAAGPEVAVTVVGRAVQDLVAVAADRTLGPDHGRLASAVLDANDWTAGRPDLVGVVVAVDAGLDVRRKAGQVDPDTLAGALDAAGKAPPPVAEWVREEVVEALLEVPPRPLEPLFARARIGFPVVLTAYSVAAESRGGTVPLERLAGWVTAWVLHSNPAERQTLLERTLPRIVAARSDAGRLGQILRRPPEQLVVATRRAPEGMLTEWWDGWSRRHGLARPARPWDVITRRRRG